MLLICIDTTHSQPEPQDVAPLLDLTTFYGHEAWKPKLRHTSTPARALVKHSSPEGFYNQPIALYIDFKKKLAPIYRASCFQLLRAHPGHGFVFKLFVLYQEAAPWRTSLATIMHRNQKMYKLMLVVLCKTCLNNTCSEAHAY